MMYLTDTQACGFYQIIEIIWKFDVMLKKQKVIL